MLHRLLVCLACLLILPLHCAPLAAQTPDFQQVFERHGAVMLLIDPTTGEILDANPAAAKFYGHGRDALRAMTIHQINTLSPEQVAAERALAVQEDRNYFIFRHALANGEIRTVEVSSHPFAFDGRNRLLSVIHDITPGRNFEHGMWHYQQRLEEQVEQRTAALKTRSLWLLAALLLSGSIVGALVFDYLRRRKVEAALAYRQALFSSFFEQAGFLAGVLDRDMRLLEVNPRALQVIGRPAADIIGQPFINTLWWQEDDKLRLSEVLARAAAGQADTFVATPPTADGHALSVQFSVVPVTVGDKQYFAVTGLDITERIQQQRELVAQRRRLSDIIEGTHAGTWEWNVQTGEAAFNERWAEIIGYRLEEIAPVSIETWTQFVHPDDLKASGELLERHFCGELPYYRCEARMRHRNGHWVWVLACGKVVTWTDDGKPLLMSGTHQDITERKHAEAALHESENRFRNLLQNVPMVAVQSYDEDGTTRYWNQASEQFYGYRADEAIGRNLLDLIIPAEMHEGVREAMRGMFETTTPIPAGELPLVRKDGSRVDVFSSHAYVRVPGRSPEMFCLDIDISKRKQSEQALQLAASVFSTAGEAITITDTDGTIIEVNDAFTHITGYGRDEVIGQNPRILSSGRQGPEFYAVMWRDLKEKGRWQGEVWNRRKNGEVYAEILTISTVRDPEGNARHYVALFSDITSIKEHQDYLEHIAHYDALTRLPNRVLLADRLQQAMTQARRRKNVLAVAFLDLDGFKAINDDYGHAVGDALLIALSARMKDSLREGDTLARIGGDEFVAVLVDLSGVEDSVPMLNRLLSAVAEPVLIGELTVQVSASLGVTFYPQEEELDADQLQRQADQAMYQAKVSGKNRYHVFDAAQDRSLRGHHESIEHIRRALVEREFTLYYQPKVNMRSGAVVGAEALIRWQHPQQGLLAPAAFLPVIENHPLAIEIGEWVIETALTQMEAWRAAGLNLPVSVNVGARQLQQPDFLERLLALLMAHPAFRPGDLEIEVLETSALEDIARVSTVIEACREWGVAFALDDFGTGYSSLTYLKRLTVTVLKIDQSFVRGMLDDPDDLAILESVIGLASAFRRVVIAEGVETKEHCEMLLQLGCDQAQGYGIARPMPADQMPAWASTWRSPPAWANCQQISHDHRPLLYAAVDHRAWIVAVEHLLKGERATPPPLDPRHCRFGLWLDAERLAGRDAQPDFSAIDTLHQQVHALVDELCKLHTEGRATEAVARLGELYSLRDALLGKMKALEASR